MTGQDQQTSTREQMVEKAARAMHDRGLLRGMEREAFDDLPSMSQSGYRDVADAAVEAVLPQVWTVEELAALPLGSVVMEGPHPWVRSSHDGGWRNGNAWNGAAAMAKRAPLTVVWTPPTT